MATLREKMVRTANGKVTVHWMVLDEDGPVVSGGIPDLDIPGGRFTVACDPARRFDDGFAASGETHVVNCPACWKHPLYAAKYEPRPGGTYEQIPAEIRQLIEAHEAAKRA